MDWSGYAVDPRDPEIIYAAFSDRDAEGLAILRVRRSTDRGETWSDDLRIIPGADAGALAVNRQGRVMLLYRRQVGTASGCRWIVHVERSDDAFATSDGLVLGEWQDPPSEGSIGSGPPSTGAPEAETASAQTGLGPVLTGDTEFYAVLPAEIRALSSSARPPNLGSRGPGEGEAVWLCRLDWPGASHRPRIERVQGAWREAMLGPDWQR